MEVQWRWLVLSVCGRSIEKHKLRYTTILCDGDSKAYDAVKGVYGPDIKVEKEDYINHV